MSAHLARPRAARFPSNHRIAQNDTHGADHVRSRLPDSWALPILPPQSARVRVGEGVPRLSSPYRIPATNAIADRHRAALRAGRKIPSCAAIRRATSASANGCARAVDLRPNSEGTVETCHSVPNSCLTLHRYLNQQIIVPESATPSQSYNTRMSASHRPTSLSVETLGCPTPVAPG